MEWVILIAAVWGFALFWCVLLMVIAGSCGWGRLAKSYRARETPPGRVYRFQTARIGWSNYGGCLTARVSEQGLGLALFPLFRPGHPPLFLPWSVLHVVKVHSHWWSRDVEIDVEDPPIVRIRLPLKLMEEARRQAPAVIDGEARSSR